MDLHKNFRTLVHPSSQLYGSERKRLTNGSVRITFRRRSAMRCSACSTIDTKRILCALPRFHRQSFGKVQRVCSRTLGLLAHAIYGQRPWIYRPSSGVSGKNRGVEEANAAGRHDAGRPHISVVLSPLCWRPSTPGVEVRHGQVGQMVLPMSFHAVSNCRSKRVCAVSSTQPPPRTDTQGRCRPAQSTHGNDQRRRRPRSRDHTAL